MSDRTEYKRLWRQKKRLEDPAFAEKEKAYRQEKYNTNLEASRAYFRSKACARRADPDKGPALRAYKKEYDRKNREKINARKQAWRENRTPEQIAKDTGYARKRRAMNPEKMKAWMDSWRARNEAHIKAYNLLNRDQKAAYGRQWKRANRERLQAEANDRYRNDPAYCIMIRLRARTRLAFSKAQARKSDRFIALTGCTEAELLSHLKSTFTDGMTWDNRSLWHVDHIRALKHFDLSDPKQQKEAFSWKNLQVLWGPDNMSKGSKLIV